MSPSLRPPVPVSAAGRDSGTGLPLRRQAVFPPFFTAGTGQSYVFRDKKKERMTTFSTILTVCLFFLESPFYPLAQPPGPVMDYNPRFGRPTARKPRRTPSAPRRSRAPPSDCPVSATTPKHALHNIPRKHTPPRPAPKHAPTIIPQSTPLYDRPRTLRPSPRSTPPRRPGTPKSREEGKSDSREALLPPSDARPILQKVVKSMIKDNIAKKMK